MSGLSQLCLSIFLIWGIAFFRIPLLLWTVLVPVILYSLYYYHWIGLSAWFILPIFLLIVIPLNLPPLRRHLTAPIFDWFRGVLPPMSVTEKEAIEIRCRVHL